MSIDRKLYLAVIEDRTDMLALDAQALVDVCGRATPFVCVFSLTATSTVLHVRDGPRYSVIRLFAR